MDNLKTLWLRAKVLESSFDAGHLRRRFLDYFEPFIESETEVVVANSHTPDGATHSIKNYVGVFRVRVAAISPEIDLEILDRVAHAKDR